MQGGFELFGNVMKFKVTQLQLIYFNTYITNSAADRLFFPKIGKQQLTSAFMCACCIMNNPFHALYSSFFQIVMMLLCNFHIIDCMAFIQKNQLRFIRLRYV